AARARGIACDDADALVHAISLFRETPRVVALAGTLLDAADRLSQGGWSDDAGGFAAEALTVFQRIGARRDAARAASILRRQGRRLPPRAASVARGVAV